jgi:hypothetical protein
VYAYVESARNALKQKERLSILGRKEKTKNARIDLSLTIGVKTKTNDFFK